MMPWSSMGAYRFAIIGSAFPRSNHASSTCKDRYDRSTQTAARALPLAVSPSSASVAAIVKQGGDEGGPACLVACPQTPASLPVEILTEEDVVTPVRVVCITCLI